MAPLEKLRVVAPPLGEREACGLAVARRQVVERTIKVRVGRLTHVDLLQQREQAVRRSNPAPPGIEVEPVQDLPATVGGGGRVQGVDLVAVAGTGEGERECRAQVPHRDVEAATKMRDRVEGAQTFRHLGAGDRVHQRAGVVVDVAAIAEIAGGARLPVLLGRQSPQQPIEDAVGSDRRRRRGDNRPQVDIDGGDPVFRRPARQSRQNDGAQPAVSALVLGEEVDEPSLVDRDDPRLVLRPAVAVVALEGREECTQHLLVGDVVLVLATVVVRDEAPPRPRECRAVRPSLQRGRDFGDVLDLLNECRLSVTRVAGDGDEPELTGEQGRAKRLVEQGPDVRLPPDRVQSAGAGVASRALAVHREQVADEGVDVRPGRVKERWLPAVRVW